MTISRLSLLAGAALTVAAVSFSASDVRAQQAVPPAPGVKPPLGQLCILTLDPRAERTGKLVDESLKKTNLTHADTVEGTLLMLDADWLVLKDGTYENWIPRDKVLFMRVSR
jgi:hypothetical protein